MEIKDEYIRGLREDIDLLYQAPQVIKLAREAIDNLPKGSKSRAKVIKQVKALRAALISLDVLCQDIEWAISERDMKREHRFFRKMKKE